MATKKPRRIYKDKNGVRLCGVTTFLGVLNKPALVKWANRLGFKKIDSSKYVDGMATIGTCCHYMIECDAKGEEPDLSEYSKETIDKAENGYLKWLEYKDNNNVEVIGSELELVSETEKFGGTIDLVAKVNGVNTLIDIKTSGSGIYDEMRIQVAAYAYLLTEHEYEIEDIVILRVGRSEEEGFEVEKVQNIDTLFKIFKCAKDIYNLKKELK